MIRLVYLSTLSAKVAEGNSYSRDLVKIMTRSRTNNKSNDISGVLIVSGNVVLQVLEGDSKAVAQLMYKISRDDRHHNLDLVYKKSVTERIYSNWSMRMIIKGTKAFAENMNKLYAADENIRLALSKKPASSRLNELLSDMSFPEMSEKDSPAIKKDDPPGNYVGKHLTISRWPRTSEFPITGQSARLCSLLFGEGLSFESLCTRSLYTDIDRLTESLDSLMLIGVLNLRASSVNENPGAASPSAKPKTDRFSHMLRNFISTAVTK